MDTNYNSRRNTHGVTVMFMGLVPIDLSGDGIMRDCSLNGMRYRRQGRQIESHLVE